MSAYFDTTFPHRVLFPIRDYLGSEEVHVVRVLSKQSLDVVQLGRLVHLIQDRLEEVTFPFVKSFPENLEEGLGLQLGQPV
jgi:hypothetical protein